MVIQLQLLIQLLMQLPKQMQSFNFRNVEKIKISSSSLRRGGTHKGCSKYFKMRRQLWLKLESNRFGGFWNKRSFKRLLFSIKNIYGRQRKQKYKKLTMFTIFFHLSFLVPGNGKGPFRFWRGIFVCVWLFLDSKLIPISETKINWLITQQ